MTYPLAYPLASMNASGICLQIEASGCNSGDDYSAVLDYPKTPSKRAGRGIARRHRQQLSARDLAVIASVGSYRYLAARQIEELHFHAHATPLTAARACRRALERLTEAELLWRLKRRIGGVQAGSASYVYALAPLGQRVLLGDETERRVRRHEPSAEFLDHALSVAELVVELHQLNRQKGNMDLLDVAPEPDCWRKFGAGLEGVRTLKPDLSVVLQVGDYEYRWFVEMDLSTHSAAAVVRKCRIYDRYWAAGIEQDRHGLFPMVLIVTPSARRTELLKRTISRASHLNTELFVVATTKDATAFLTGAAS